MRNKREVERQNYLKAVREGKLKPLVIRRDEMTSTDDLNDDDKYPSIAVALPIVLFCCAFWYGIWAGGHYLLYWW